MQEKKKKRKSQSKAAIAQRKWRKENAEYFREYHALATRLLRARRKGDPDAIRVAHADLMLFKERNSSRKSKTNNRFVSGTVVKPGVGIVPREDA